MEMKYIAIKVSGISRWLWFKQENVTRSNGVFVGKEGWGHEKELTEILVRETLIEGELRANEMPTEI